MRNRNIYKPLFIVLSLLLLFAIILFSVYLFYGKSINTFLAKSQFENFLSEMQDKDFEKASKYQSINNPSKYPGLSESKMRQKYLDDVKQLYADGIVFVSHSEISAYAYESYLISTSSAITVSYQNNNYDFYIESMDGAVSRVSATGTNDKLSADYTCLEKRLSDALCLYNPG